MYMPTDYGTIDCLDEYTDTCMCSKISALYADNDAVFLLVAGDFNCGISSRFYYMISQFCHDNQLICSDMHVLQMRLLIVMMMGCGSPGLTT